MAIGTGVLTGLGRVARAVRHPVLAATVRRFAKSNPGLAERIGGAGSLFDVACKVNLPKHKKGDYYNLGEEYKWDMINPRAYAPLSRIKTSIAASILANTSAAARFASAQQIPVSSVKIIRTAYDWRNKRVSIKEDLDYKDTIEVFNLRAFRVNGGWFKFAPQADKISYNGNLNRNFQCDWAWVGWQY